MSILERPDAARRVLMHEHVGSLHDLVALIERELAARSIMTPWADIKAVTAETNNEGANSEAKRLMDDNEYSAVPLEWDRSVRGVYLRYQPKEVPIFESVTSEHFVDPEMRLIGLIRWMRKHSKIVVGVGTADAPLGWLTYADFSKRPFRVLLFAIVAEVEFLLATAIDRTHPTDAWVARLPRPDRKCLEKRKKEAADWDVTMPLTTFADISHLVESAVNSPGVQKLLAITEEDAIELKSFSELRNRVDHVVRPVVAGPKKIESVAKQIDVMLNWIESWTTRVAN